MNLKTNISRVNRNCILNRDQLSKFKKDKEILAKRLKKLKKNTKLSNKSLKKLFKIKTKT